MYTHHENFLQNKSISVTYKFQITSTLRGKPVVLKSEGFKIEIQQLTQLTCSTSVNSLKIPASKVIPKPRSCSLRTKSPVIRWISSSYQ